MTYMQAACAILRASRKPLTTRELIDRAISQGLVAPRGRTPEASMAAELYRYLQDHPDGEIERCHEPGPLRARRGSVRWAWRRGR